MSFNDDEDYDRDITEPLKNDYANDLPSLPYPQISNQRNGQNRTLANLRDPFFGFLFALNFCLIVFLAFFKGIPKISQGVVDLVIVDTNGSEREGNDSDNPIPVVLAISVIMVVASFLSTLSLKILISFGEKLIRFCFLSSVVCFVVFAVLALSIGQYIVTSLLLLAGILTYVYYFYMDSEIEFAGKNLKVACLAVQSMPETISISIVLLLSQILWCLLWTLALIGFATNYAGTILGPDGTKYDPNDCVTYQSYSPNPTFSSNCVSGIEQVCYKCVCNDATIYENKECRTESVDAGKYALLLLSLLWGCSVISNVSHCATAGAVAAWWFDEATPNRNLESAERSSPAYGSLKRAVTTSFGTVCFASLLFAVAKLLVLIASSLRRSRRGMGSFGTALVECLAQAAEKVIKIFNKYALCHSAIYGTNLTRSGKEIWALFRKRGWIYIINDQLCENVFTLICVVVAALCGILAAFTGVLLGLSGLATSMLVSFGVFAGYNLSSVTVNVVSSALATVLVCFGLDHVSLANSHPELWAEMLQSWHRVHGSTMANCGYPLP